MEVFMTNLPAQGNFGDRVLREQLKPFMKNLAIAEKSFNCEKPLNRKHGTITFLNESDGRKFLQFYGESKLPHGRTASRLKILGAKVLCRLSQRQPNTFTLKHLRAEVDKPNRPPEERRGGYADFLPSFKLHSLQCGYYRYNQGRLEYVPEMKEVGEGAVTFGKRYLTVDIFRDSEFVNESNLLYIPLGTIYEIVWSANGELTLTLQSAPFIFVDTEFMQQSGRVRQTQLSPKHAEVGGTCLIYRINVDPVQLQRKMDYLNTMLTVTRYDVSNRLAPPIADSLKKLHAKLASMLTSSKLPFSILFQLQALAWNAFLYPDTVADLASELVVLQKTAPVSVDAMKMLFTDIGWPTPNDADPSQFEVPALVAHLLKKEREIRSGYAIREGLLSPSENLAPICRVSVTPTRILLYGPEFEKKNRVLRKFPNQHDCFIRVQFCDENGDSLRLLGRRTSYEKVYKRFIDIMKNGIQIVGRTYKFLGWSHSSLRAHSMWFTAPFIDDTGRLQTHLTIISTLGDFAGIRSPAKCAARIGQAFSETPYAVPLSEHKISVMLVDDVKSKDGKHVFSDGVGTISLDAAAAVWKYVPKSKRNPTCFQVRYAGAKGMLSLDTRLQGSQILLRPSMIKFESNETENLEICDVAKAMPLYLNRQMIKILEDMSVPRKWFLRLQNDALQQLRLIASSAYNMAYFLKHQSVGTSIKLHKLLLLTDKLGLDYRTEPFLRRAAEAVVLRELRLLKHKARIPVPFGITLFGVMDETEFLAKGQVYVTFETKQGLKPQRFEQPPGHAVYLLVTRSPALHPGDIQWACNMIPPEGHPLRELSNCVVFSAKGARDLPSQLSGGDLDGDIFNLIWDREVCRPVELKTYRAAEYARVPPQNIWREVQTEDIAQFFIDFMKTDHLGTIATRHMILADQKEMGTLDSDCIAMAELHSTAVDFSKTGIPADLNELRRASPFRPDFLAPGSLVYVHNKADIELEKYVANNERDVHAEALDGPAHKYYRSEKVLGVLYRAVDERKIWYTDIHKGESETTTTDGTGAGTVLDKLREWARKQCAELGCDSWHERQEEAAGIRSAYEDSIRSMMHSNSENPMQPISELEVFTGALISKTGAQNNRQRDRSRKLREEFERISSWITGQMRPRERQQAADGRDMLEWMELCLACAHSREVRDEDERWGNTRSDAIQSFPLVAMAALLREIDYRLSPSGTHSSVLEHAGLLRARSSSGGMRDETNHAVKPLSVGDGVMPAVCTVVITTGSSVLTDL
ncbi:RNA-dependent RNA polymerase [Grosmannia clavigera kw1407]|uniref:RNA-dependent RNA polymerase n=1 Tax=Grosmannia clavigera (strain kw1407 / UAMH 11150) TaxID=655863 RepID=F0X765_GROCL|nr:RNA-dependent RNA polymerase [Grosmannia clavigera kw1407]EFX06378.1 RNA-dependent RNA polymerase [Grosmannia clavigera kw1407]